MKNPTNRVKEKEQFKSIAKDSSDKFAKTESLALSCRFCGSSNVVKFGYNETKGGRKARYKCGLTTPSVLAHPLVNMALSVIFLSINFGFLVFDYFL